MKKLFIALAVVLLIPSVLFSAPLENDSNIELDTMIFTVATGGLWKHNQNYGNIRVVVQDVGWEHTRSIFYIQWLRTNDLTQTVEVFKTAPIRELNIENWVNIKNIERISGNGSAKFKIWYFLRGEDKVTSSVLSVGNPTAYKLTKQ